MWNVSLNEKMLSYPTRLQNGAYARDNIIVEYVWSDCTCWKNCLWLYPEIRRSREWKANIVYQLIKRYPRVGLCPAAFIVIIWMWIVYGSKLGLVRCVYHDDRQIIVSTADIKIDKFRWKLGYLVNDETLTCGIILLDASGGCGSQMYGHDDYF